MTNQDFNLDRVLFDMDDDYRLDYDIVVSNQGHTTDVLITIPDTIEIVLKDFHTSKTEEVTLPDTKDNVTVTGVSYPLDEVPEDLGSMSLIDLLSTSRTNLELLIESEKLTEVVRKSATLWIGNSFSMRLPIEFAERLQHFLTTGEVRNE